MAYTRPAMEAPLGKFAARIGALAALGMVLSGCAGAFEAETDATSPLAPRIQAIVDANRAYPSWADFPRSTEPLPAPTQIAAQVDSLTRTRGALAEEAARIDWTLTDDPAVFAQGVRDRVNAVPVAPVTADTQAEIDAFARRLRERGRAPPPVDRD